MKTIQNTDTSRSMVRSAISFFCGTLLSRITGMLRDVAMAIAFGTEASLAAFFVAFRFSHLLRRIFGESALQSAFIPHFEELRSNSTKESQRSILFFVDLYLSLSFILLLIIGVVMATCSWMLHFLSLSISTKEIISLTQLMLPSLLFICLAGLNSALLQCEKSFFLTGISPVAFNLIWILGIFVASGQEGSKMVKMSLWIVVACFCQWLVTLPRVISIVSQHIKQSKEFKFFRIKVFFSDDLRTLWKPFSLGILGVGAAQINSACDAVFARYAESEGPAYLWYAIRLQQLPLALFGIAVASALMPPLTRRIQAGELENASKLFTEATARTLLIMLPMTCAIFLLGERSIDFLYGYGDFGQSSIKGTTTSLSGYTLGLIPMALILIFAPTFYAQKDYRTPAAASLWAMLLNIFLNGLFIFGFHGDAFSVALATSFSAWMNCIYLVMLMDKTMKKSIINAVEQVFTLCAKAILLATCLTWGLAAWFPQGESLLYKGLYLSCLAAIFSVIFISFCPASIGKKTSLSFDT